MEGEIIQPWEGEWEDGEDIILLPDVGEVSPQTTAAADTDTNVGANSSINIESEAMTNYTAPSAANESVFSSIHRRATSAVAAGLKGVTDASTASYHSVRAASSATREAVVGRSTMAIESISSLSMPTIDISLRKRPTWNNRFSAAVQVLRMAAAATPHNITAMRLMTDHGVPTWLPTLPSSVESKKSVHPPGEWYYPKHVGLQVRVNADPKAMIDGKYILYFHGGAFCCCNSATHRGLLFRLVEETQATIFSINYRRPPEHPYPAPVDDCISAFLFILEKVGDANRIILSGDSAGGNLVISTLLRLHELGLPAPAGGVLISPWVDLTDFDSPSWVQYYSVDYLDAELAKLFARCYQGECGRFTLVELSPTNSKALDTMPPLLVEVGECEVLRDQIIEFSKKVETAGGKITCNIRQDMIHVFPIYSFTGMPQCQEAFKAIVHFVNELFHTVTDDDGVALATPEVSESRIELENFEKVPDDIIPEIDYTIVENSAFCSATASTTTAASVR